jgi:Fic family protein
VPGEIRTRVNWIGGLSIATSTYNPPAPADVPACLGETAAYMRVEGMQAMTQSLITRIALAHAHFEAVHPFRDGNGRVGRLLISMMMAADGHTPLYLSPYIEANKPAYYAGLKAAQQRLEWEPLIVFLSDAITGSVEELLATRAALKALRDLWLSRRRFRVNSAALRMIDVLVDYPVTTARRMAERLDLSMPATLTGIGQLIDAGIIKERTGNRRNRIFAAPEVLALLNRPFGSEPAPPGAD